jgi:hypothetical protein
MAIYIVRRSPPRNAHRRQARTKTGREGQLGALQAPEEPESIEAAGSAQDIALLLINHPGNAKQ